MRRRTRRTRTSTPADVPADAAGDAEPVPYQGPTSGGSIPLPPLSEADASYDVVVEADNRCCHVTFALADSTADEAAPTLLGNLFPLDIPGGWR